MRIEVAKTAKSVLRFCLFVIFLSLLSQLLSIRKKKLQAENLTTSTIINDPDTPVIRPLGGTS